MALWRLAERRWVLARPYSTGRKARANRTCRTARAIQRTTRGRSAATRCAVGRSLWEIKLSGKQRANAYSMQRPSRMTPRKPPPCSAAATARNCLARSWPLRPAQSARSSVRGSPQRKRPRLALWPATPATSWLVSPTVGGYATEVHCRRSTQARARARYWPWPWTALRTASVSQQADVLVLCSLRCRPSSIHKPRHCLTMSASAWPHQVRLRGASPLRRHAPTWPTSW